MINPHKYWEAITAMLVFLIFGIVLLFFPKDLQQAELKSLSNSNDVSDKVPKRLKPLASRLRRFSYQSRAGENYIVILRLIDLGAIIMALIGLYQIVFRK